MAPTTSRPSTSKPWSGASTASCSPPTPNKRSGRSKCKPRKTTHLPSAADRHGPARRTPPPSNPSADCCCSSAPSTTRRPNPGTVPSPATRSAPSAASTSPRSCCRSGEGAKTRSRVKQLSQTQPEHPLLATFLPYLIEDPARLREQAPIAYGQIQQAPLSEPPAATVSMSSNPGSWRVFRTRP